MESSSRPVIEPRLILYCQKNNYRILLEGEPSIIFPDSLHALQFLLLLFPTTSEKVVVNPVGQKSMLIGQVANG